MHIEYFKEIEVWLEDFLWPESDARQRAKRERLLASATRLFVHYGYRKTSIDEVAKAAGVAKGTVYLYYRNKAELILHAIALEKRLYLNRFKPLLTSATVPAGRLQALIALGLVAMREMPLMARLTSGDQEIALALQVVDGSVLDRINSWRRDFMISLLRELGDGRWSQDELLVRAQVLIDLVLAVTVSGQIASHEDDLEEYAWTLAATLVHGIAAPAIQNNLRSSLARSGHETSLDQTEWKEVPV